MNGLRKDRLSAREPARHSAGHALANKQTVEQAVRRVDRGALEKGTARP